VKILVIGKNGQIGWELQRTLAPLGNVIALDRADLDLTDQDAIRSRVREIQPELIVNAAAYTAVDQAESEPEVAYSINATAPGVLAEEARALSAWLLHYSTDYVFDGAKSGPYEENDCVNPLSVYGASKLAGEQAIAATGGRYLILRTSWVYGARGKNFLLTIMRLAREREELRVVADQVGSPTWSRMVAEATAQIAIQLLSAPRRSRQEAGIYHLTCAGETSWYDFAREIVKWMTSSSVTAWSARCPDGPRLVPIPTSEYPRPARRPANSCLACAKLHTDFRITLPPWSVALSLCFDDLLE